MWQTVWPGEQGGLTRSPYSLWFSWEGQGPPASSWFLRGSLCLLSSLLPEPSPRHTAHALRVQLIAAWQATSLRIQGEIKERDRSDLLRADIQGSLWKPFLSTVIGYPKYFMLQEPYIYSRKDCHFYFFRSNLIYHLETNSVLVPGTSLVSWHPFKRPPGDTFKASRIYTISYNVFFPSACGCGTRL